jgi:hypothetical protein
MNRVGRTVLIFALAGATFAANADAQSSGGQYNIASVAIAGGGGPISGGVYQITSTLGQPATAVLGAGNYIIFDGFWGPVSSFVNDLIFADGFE